MAMPPAEVQGEFHQIALTKMTAVLGAERARQLIALLVTQPGVTIATADDLLHFAETLVQLGGFEGAVGALLTVIAVMRGASGPRG